MINSPELREKCAQELLGAVDRAGKMAAFVGLDGFVDEIIHMVDSRQNADSFTRIPTITKFSQRIGAAAGKSANIEMVTTMTKLGGNGPIMANALSSFGIKVTYVGALGYPTLHPVFQDFAKKADVHSICEAAHTDALEFEDGKLMLGKMTQLNDVNWANIKANYGEAKFSEKFNKCALVGFVNWTMIPHMSDIWEAMQKELCPKLTGPRRKMFFDLADPEKRSAKEISHALKLMQGFEKHFDAILGLNEKEAFEIGDVLGLGMKDHSPEGIGALTAEIQKKVKINTVVVHPVAFAAAASKGDLQVVKGPFCAKPKISTGAGDHFNSGFCLGKMLGFDNAMSLMTGVSTSGFYVRTAKSPNMAELAGLLKDWPKE
jgi:sugar/nucleoside kinase (ribokinase family)